MDEKNQYPGFLTVASASETLGLTSQAVRGLLAKGVLAGQRVGRIWIIPSESVEKLVVERGINSPQSSQKTKKHVSKGAKLRALSFFSGAMGLDLGLERSGVETILACENDKWSRRTIEANRPDLPLLGNIWEHDAASVRKSIGLSPKENIDVVIGGPPCQAFSTAGGRKGFEDDRGNVFLHFIELSLDLAPNYIVIENVRGLLSAPMKHRPHSLRGSKFPPLEADELPGGALSFVLFLLQSAGYGVSFELYNAANFGAPQTRERVIVICSKDGNSVPHLSPTHSESPTSGLKPWRTFRDAVQGLESVQHHYVKFPEERLRFFRLLGPGQHWRHLPLDLQKEALGNSFYSGGGKTGFFRRLAWDKPSPTLVTHPAMPATDLAHPEEPRPLSVEEYKRIQEFPDYWEILGPVVQQYKQIGNAVPVSLGAAVGRTLIAHSSGKMLPKHLDFRYSRYRDTDELSWKERFQHPNIDTAQPSLF